jgi:GT2 family glycosyltransferase
VVICAFSLARLEQTIRCVGAVLGQRFRPEQVLVVVDHNDELRRTLRARLPPEVEVIDNTGEHGLASARNTAVRASSGDTIVFIDDDAVPQEHWLDTLMAAFDDPAVVGAGGHAIPVWEDEQPAWFPDEFLWVVGCSYRGLPKMGAIRNPLGCNMAFRAELFDRVGLFDPGMGRLGSRPLGCEETEFCIRATRAVPDARLVLTAGAEIEHAVSQERGRPSYLLRRCFYEGISKALVRRLGDTRSLDTERNYLRRTLPARLALSARAVVTGPRRSAALGQIGAVLGALFAAGLGYSYGKIVFSLRRPAASPGARPAESHAHEAAGRVLSDR